MDFLDRKSIQATFHIYSSVTFGLLFSMLPILHSIRCIDGFNIVIKIIFDNTME